MAVKCVIIQNVLLKIPLICDLCDDKNIDQTQGLFDIIFCNSILWYEVSYSYMCVILNDYIYHDIKSLFDGWDVEMDVGNGVVGR